VGDIVLLYEGDVVPADGVLLSGISLFTGQGFGFGVCDCFFPSEIFLCIGKEFNIRFLSAFL